MVLSSIQMEFKARKAVVFCLCQFGGSTRLMSCILLTCEVGTNNLKLLRLHLHPTAFLLAGNRLPAHCETRYILSSMVVSFPSLRRYPVAYPNKLAIMRIFLPKETSLSEFSPKFSFIDEIVFYGTIRLRRGRCLERADVSPPFLKDLRRTLIQHPRPAYAHHGSTIDGAAHAATASTSTTIPTIIALGIPASALPPIPQCVYPLFSLRQSLRLQQAHPTRSWSCFRQG